MNNLILFTFLFPSIFFITNQPELEIAPGKINIETPVTFKEFSVNDKDYILHFSLEKTKEHNNILAVSVALKNDSYYVSPNSERDYTGKFYMDLGDDKDLEFKGGLIELPHSVETYESNTFANGVINLTRTDTTYKQYLNIKTKEEFIVFGRVQFTIEPRCTFEQIPFAISFKDGKIAFIEPKC